MAPVAEPGDPIFMLSTTVRPLNSDTLGVGMADLDLLAR